MVSVEQANSEKQRGVIYLYLGIIVGVFLLILFVTTHAALTGSDLSISDVMIFVGIDILIFAGCFFLCYKLFLELKTQFTDEGIHQNNKFIPWNNITKVTQDNSSPIANKFVLHDPQTKITITTLFHKDPSTIQQLLTERLTDKVTWQKVDV